MILGVCSIQFQSNEGENAENSKLFNAADEEQPTRGPLGQVSQVICFFNILQYLQHIGRIKKMLWPYSSKLSYDQAIRTAIMIGFAALVIFTGQRNTRYTK